MSNSVFENSGGFWVICLRQLELGSVSSRVPFGPSSDRDNCLIRVSSSAADQGQHHASNALRWTHPFHQYGHQGEPEGMGLSWL